MSDAQARDNVAVWFEIPARDFARAVTFYETLFATTLRQESFGGPKMAVFPYQQPGVSGAVIEAGMQQPGSGTLVYLNCDGRLDEVAGRVGQAGGKLASPFVDLPPGMGRFVQIEDCEGNRLGLHSR